uniref:Uncharacterized protein n=1 Tax=Anguilla anguilla TaxID=7936 RepID=A0A0E9WAN8_ANGAN
MFNNTYFVRICHFEMWNLPLTRNVGNILESDHHITLHIQPGHCAINTSHSCKMNGWELYLQAKCANLLMNRGGGGSQPAY